MAKPSWSPDRVLVVAVLGLSTIATILDFSGLLDNVPWLVERVPVLTLLGMSLIASSFYFDGERLESKIQKFTRQNHAELVAALGVDNAGVQLLSRLNSRWIERETEVRRFLELAVDASSVDAMCSYVARTQAELIEGTFGDGARVRFPWDVTVMVMDHSGRLLYHPNAKIVDTRPNQPHHAQVLRDRTGECVWINQFITRPVQEVLGVGDKPEFKVDRLTKVYFREAIKFNAVVIFESHLDVLYQIPR